jgi:glucose-1-phosphate thymidylyltransferase
MKGILLAGGTATRLYPVTKVVSKQLLPVYDKPMVYYSLSTLMLAGIRDILLISSPHDLPKFKDLLGDGSKLGINISYAEQQAPRGLPESFIIGEEFIGRDSVCLMLGDNIHYGNELVDLLRSGADLKSGALLISSYVKDPERHGIIEFGEDSEVISIEEKPKDPKSNWAVTGMFFYDNDVVGIAKGLKPSKRGELEITDVSNEYLRRGKLKAVKMGRGFAWLDTGTHESLIDASMFIKTIEDRQGLKIGCIEEVAYRMGFIDAPQLERLSASLPPSYRNYLKWILKHG